MKAIITTTTIAVIAIITILGMVQQSANALILAPIIKANLAPDPYGIKNEYVLKNLVVTNKTNASGKTFSMVGYTPQPQVMITETGRVAFVGKFVIQNGPHDTEYIPMSIGMRATHITTDPKTNTTTMELGSNSNIDINAPIPATGKIVLTGNPETSTIVIQAVT